MASNEEEATLLIDDLDTLSYFSPTLTRKPSPLPSTSTIVSSLLSSAGLPSSYPPADLTTLITAIETTSTFDTLRRNGLLLYLLIDVSTSPSVVDAFCNARLIPTFWRTSVEAYHAFDHGSYAKAMPHLSKENAEPYTRLVLRRLDPREDAKLARYALQFVKVARPDVVKASREAQQAVSIAKAIGEGLAAALELARTIDPAASAAQALWPWLFAKRRPKLLAEFVRLPFTPQEVQGVREFALAPTSSSSSASTAAAQRRAIDALLLRLLNAGQVVEALRLDREAEEHGLGGDGEEGDEASVAAVKQRREMLRLARQSLPATLRLELEDDEGEEAFEGGNGRAAGMQVDGAGDVSMSGAAGGSRVPSRTGLLINKSTAAAPSSPLVTLPRSASRSLALASQSPLAGSGLGGSSSSSFTSSPRPQPRGGLPLPRAGYASPSPRPATSALPSTAAARQADTSMQASTSFSSSSNAGPYARLAAQLASAQPQGANDSGNGSALLSSLLPQKRAALSSASLASRAAGGASGDTIMVPAAAGEGDVSMDRTMTPPPAPAAGSAFEVPKRRYVPKANASSTRDEGQQSLGRARGQRQRSQAADGAAAKARGARGAVGASPHKKQRQMHEDEQDEEGEEEEPAKERQATTTTKARMPRSRSTMPGSFFGDDEEMHEGQHEEEPEPEAVDAGAKTSSRATRTQKGKQGNAGATTARRDSRDAAASTATPRRKTATTTQRRRRETSTTSSLAATSPSAHEDEADEIYAPPTTRRMTRSQSVMSAVSDAAGGGGETYDTWTSGTTGDNTARDPLWEEREEEDEDEGEEEDETDEDGQQGGRRRTRTSSSGGRKTTREPTTAGGAKRSTRQRSAQPTSSTPKASPQKRRTGAAAAVAAAGSATSTPRRSTRRGGA